jgi:hypothetical protein
MRPVHRLRPVRRYQEASLQVSLGNGQRHQAYQTVVDRAGVVLRADVELGLAEAYTRGKRAGDHGIQGAHAAQRRKLPIGGILMQLAGRIATPENADAQQTFNRIMRSSRIRRSADAKRELESKNMPR